MRILVTLEAAEGQPERYARDGNPPAWTLYDTLPHPWPTAYGFVENTTNPADGEEWDVIIVSPCTVAAMSTIAADIVGILLREDGDHKLLAVLPDDATLGEPPDLNLIPAARRIAIAALYGARSPITGWGDRATAVALFTAPPSG